MQGVPLHCPNYLHFRLCNVNLLTNDNQPRERLQTQNVLVFCKAFSRKYLLVYEKRVYKTPRIVVKYVTHVHVTL